MNVKLTRSSNPVHRLLGVFEEHPEVDAIVVYASLFGLVEARALDRRGRSVPIDSRSALGERAWSKLSDEAQRGAPIIVARKDAQAQSSCFFGAVETALHERDALFAATPNGIVDFPAMPHFRDGRL